MKFFETGPLMRQTTLLLGAIWLGLSFTIQASSQDLAQLSKEVSPTAFVKTFLGLCAQTPGNFERAIKLADAAGYEALPDELKPLMAPQDPKSEFEGYLVMEGTGAPFLFGIARGVMDNESIISCSVMNPYIAPSAVLPALQALANIGAPDHVQNSMGAQWQIWQTNDVSDFEILTMLDNSPMSEGGVTLSFMAKEIR